MNIPDFLSGPISGLVEAVGGVIDDLHTSEEEKQAARRKLQEVVNRHRAKLVAHAEAIASYQRDTITSEAESKHWLAANWRPILMLVFTYIIAHNYVIAPVFGVAVAEIPADMWDLLKIGVGGYIVGRSAEKVAPRVWGRRGGEE